MGSHAFTPGVRDRRVLAGAVSVGVETQGRRTRAGSQLLDGWGGGGREGGCTLWNHGMVAANWRHGRCLFVWVRRVVRRDVITMSI